MISLEALNLVKIAPKCYYTYDQVKGSRPCTINMERYHALPFKELNLPNCPFTNECFTRSDCRYITGKCSEEEGAEIVKRELGVDVLTLDNTKSFWPYL